MAAGAFLPAAVDFGRISDRLLSGTLPSIPRVDGSDGALRAEEE